MATVAPPSFSQVEPADPSFKPQEISFPLPKALHTTAHVHLTFLDHCAMVFLATSTPGDSGGTVKPLGSFVYAMPDVSFHLGSTLVRIIYVVCDNSSMFYPRPREFQR